MADGRPDTGSRERLRIHFEELNGGWLPLRIELGDAEVVCVASYTPEDSLWMLIDGLPRILDPGGTLVVRFHTEPERYDLMLERRGPKTGIRVTHHPHWSDPGDGSLALEGEVDTEDTLLAFWRGLRGLEASASAEELTKEWGHRFPDEGMARLTRLAHDLKQRSRS